MGVGLDLPWQGPYGIVDGRVSPRTVRFLKAQAHRFAYMFVSWQPRGKNRPALEDVVDAWDALFDAVPIAARGLHQTALNLAGADYDRGRVIDITNALIERYGFLWVNEDLGSWSAGGRPMPYPQPPPLTAEGIAFCARACAEVNRALAAPLVAEFPGFETPALRAQGSIDAYDAFAEVVERADVLCTLDTGHLLTWRWLQGYRGDALLGDLHRLPLDRCVEIHCAGTTLTRTSMIDAHHGILLDCQLKLASRLMAACPNLRVVTYEDPRFSESGVLPAAARVSLDALERRTQEWMAQPSAPRPPSARWSGLPAAPSARWDRELFDSFSQATPFGQRCRAQLMARSTHRLGRLQDLYPHAIAAWCSDHPGEEALDRMLQAFVSSEAGESWSELPWAVPGRCVEDAFGRFLAPGSGEHLRACARVLAAYPDPDFEVPEPFQPAARGWFTIDVRDTPTLYAAIDGRCLIGPITPLLSQLLAGHRPAGSGPAVGALQRMGLVA